MMKLQLNHLTDSYEKHKLLKVLNISYLTFIHHKGFVDEEKEALDQMFYQ